MKYRSTLLAICLALSPAILLGQSSQAPADTVRTTGIMRPKDALKQDIQWNRASSDLFTYWADNGLFGMSGPQPEIFIEGIPVDANFFGWHNFNMLPIINAGNNEYDHSASLYRNTLTPAGYIDFKNIAADTGLTATGSVFVGNETGDPGPYVYDSLKTTPNIDRWGPDREVALAYRGSGWYSKVLFILRNHSPTDLISNTRLHFTASLLGTNRKYVNHLIYTDTQSGLFETGYQTDSWLIRGRATYGKSLDYIFLQPFGREIPAETGYRQGAFETTYNSGSWTFTGRYIGHQKTMDKRIDLHPYIFDWNQREHTVSFSAEFIKNNYQVKPGVSYQQLRTIAPGLDNLQDKLLTLSVNAALPISENSSLKTQLSGDYADDKLAKVLRFSLPAQLTASWKIIPQITNMEVLPVRQQSFSYWIARGYTFANELGIEYTTSPEVEKNRLTKFQLRNNVTITPDITLIIKPQIINHQSLNIPFQQVEAYEFVTDTQPGPFSITHEKGTRLGLVSQLNHSVNTYFRQSLSVNLQRTLSGSARYGNYFAQVPETKVQYQVDARPAPSLVISLNALYRSSANWTGFEAIEGNKYRLLNGIPIRRVTGTFHTHTPAYLDIGLSVNKWFWDRRLSTEFSVKNLLNEDLRMHPLGAELSTKFDLKVSLTF